jgi:hypothetical protein
MTTEHLSDQQIARLEALHAAREVGRTTTGAFGGAKPPDIPELVDLAEYIIHGIHPMDRYYEDQQAKEVKSNGDEADAGESAETPAGG